MPAQQLRRVKAGVDDMRRRPFPKKKQLVVEQSGQRLLMMTGAARAAARATSPRSFWSIPHRVPEPHQKAILPAKVVRLLEEAWSHPMFFLQKIVNGCTSQSFWLSHGLICIRCVGMVGSDE